MDTTLDFKNLLSLNKYWKIQNKKIYNFSKIIPSSYSEKNKARFYADSVVLFQQDLYTVLLFKTLRKIKKEAQNLYAITYNISFSNLVSINDRIELFNSFSFEIRNSTDGKKIYNQLLDYSNKLNFLPANKYLSDSYVKGQKGEVYKLAKVFNSKKQFYLFIIGASWCSPCRHENRMLNSIFNSIDTSKIQIIGLSIDDDYSKWKLALKQDACKWTNLLLIGGANSKLYTENVKYGIPYNLLYNSSQQLISSHSSLQLLLKKIPMKTNSFLILNKIL
ncbi:thioredoxin-like domain-containing protein [Sediminibacterium sp.]|uniref:TlpA family protein disulfide reductase n=1 Tax=Sediminibacterium sp. TaxID=1917865 RepID=UPI002735D7DE|nr:thioredoxin-like domain-containing protein [Sediminibacterium sp.]MDP3394318.1 thioredoxin-like domain-containing protein [Sediminibacterium sp.]MDP3568153.1 thioredoxin-like domain-containing protein [Sediminibacterium sp.]